LLFDKSSSRWGEPSSIHGGILAFVNFHVRNDFFKRMLLADDRDFRRVSSWLDVSLLQSPFPLLLLVSFPMLGGYAAMYHGMYVRWNDLSMATHVDDNDHEFPVI
jgi:hypothetical protein